MRTRPGARFCNSCGAGLELAAGDPRQAKPERGRRDVIVISETFRRSPAGTQSRPAKVGHQRVPSVAWWRSDPRCEAYTGIAEAA